MIEVAWKLAKRFLVGVVLIILLTACGTTGPVLDRPLIKQALAIALQQTQQELRQELRLDDQPAKIEIQRFKIIKQTPLAIQDLQSYQIRGTYDFTMQLPDRQIIKRDNPFEVYLQQQIEGKTWRLAQLEVDEAGEPVWVTQRIP